MSKQLRIWLFVLLGTLLASTSLLAEGVITMTTTKKVGENIGLTIKANGNVTIEGVKEAPRTEDWRVPYTLTSQTVTIRGDVTELSCYNNQLTSLDVLDCTALSWLECYENYMTSLNISGCTALTTLNCCGNYLTSLDVSKNVALTTLDCSGNQLTSLDVLACTALTKLTCGGNQLTSLDVSKNVALTDLNCGWNQLTSLDLSKNSALTTLQCSSNQLTSLDLSKNSALTDLYCTSNLLRGLNISGCNNLNVLECYKNQIKGTQMANLVNNLPDRQGKEEGFFRVFSTESYGGVDGNVCLAADVATAKAKNWRTLYYRERDREWRDYTGLDNPIFTVTYSSSRGGSIIITGADDLENVPYGTELTVTETNVADGYKLTTLTANGQDILKTKRFKVTANTRVEATFTLQVYNVTTIKLGEGTLYVSGADDLEAVTPGTELTVTAIPAEGYELTELTANDRNILDTKKVVVNEDLIIKAIFSQKTFKVSLTKHGNGTIRAIGADNLDAVPFGTELTIEATPATGSTLTALVAGAINIIETKKVTIKKETTIEAFFTTQTFNVTLTKEGKGTISATGAEDLDAVDYGTELTIEATPATGYELTALTANGRDILSTKRFVVKGDTEVKATFTQKTRTYTVTFIQTGEGYLDATGADDLNAVPYGTELTVVATPTAGYELTALTANDKDILATKKVVVTENTTIKATFAKKTFVVTLDKEGEGVLDATGADNLKAVPYGTKLTITAIPAEGYELKALLANGFDIRSTKSVEVTGDTRIKAIFTQQTFAVTLTSNEHGKVKIVEPVDLKAVPYGTTLTISATPETGYELTALTANGEDILATKSFVVKGATEIRATFSMAHFAVTLTHEGEGKVDATGAENLTAVSYGTELTIVAHPKQGYELTALTANDKDILATRKVVVTEDLTVKATFAKETFVVTLDKEGEGVLDATGADNLKAVPYGTKLTIIATPAEGYELKALLADGFDIRSTKSVEVTGDTRIKAIFTQQTFAATLTSNEHGKITIAEPVDLKVVPYGTKLTVKATGKNAQCVLTALTANGEDILATQSFVVKGATEVKATFVDHTGVETTVTQQTQLYPNPATDYVIVEGVAPASEVTLHSMTGERLYAGRADSRGTLRIDLTPYADGVYLVCVADETYRVVVRH